LGAREHCWRQPLLSRLCAAHGHHGSPDQVSAVGSPLLSFRPCSRCPNLIQCLNFPVTLIRTSPYPDCWSARGTRPYCKTPRGPSPTCAAARTRGPRSISSFLRCTCSTC
jgi:hypothetical protein